jgi:uncharacterized protein
MPDRRHAYLDIETTGLDPRQHQVTLVGIAWTEGRTRRVEQHFVARPRDERSVLRAVARRLEDFAGVVTYNGAAFDLPFLRVRGRRCRVTFPDLPNHDLLPVARQWRKAYGGLQNCRLSTVAEHFGLERADHTTGRDAVEAYYEWLETGDPAAREQLLAHNRDDVLVLIGLGPRLREQAALTLRRRRT